MTGVSQVFTVGHDGHPFAVLRDLLRAADVEIVVDVRSVPWSRRHAQYRRELLALACDAAGLGYRWEPALGGRPADPGLYDVEGHVRYGDIAAGTAFTAAVEELVTLADGHRVVLLCAEEDPVDCHRRLLLGPPLTDRGVVLHHLRADGRIELEPSVVRGAGQLGLFAGDDPWRSRHPVTPPPQT